MDLMAEGAVRPPPPRKVFTLDEAAAAVNEARQEAPGGAGKVMLSNQYL